MKTGTRRKIWMAVGIVGLVFVLLATTFVLGVRRHLPPGIMKDIRAGRTARHISDPDARLKQYLEARYGAMDVATNREKMFLDFFDLNHIKALQLLVKYSPEKHREENILAMSRWVQHYRESMTSEEHSDLKQKLTGTAGETMLKQATAQYNSQDVQYRGQTAPVISQLLQTLYSIQH
ncbi:MAG TPA: hypothetical protein VG938_18555 [Verrucomicrobiae bacterium]|jgi:hypothetical protein|nr:hypothetical protein [Verrucomicrobiae bacterium]